MMLRRAVQCARSRLAQPVRRYGSPAHSSAEATNYTHFENYRPEDTLPFGTDNKFFWGLKLGVVSAVGFGAPIFIVWWQA